MVSASALDDAQKNYEMALNKQNVSKAQVTVLKAKIAQSQAQVAEDQANLKQLEEQLSYTDIVSPIDGIVLSRDVRDGRRGELDPGVGLVGHAGHDAGRYQRSLCKGQSGRERHRQGVSGTARRGSKWNRSRTRLLTAR